MTVNQLAKKLQKSEGDMEVFVLIAGDSNEYEILDAFGKCSQFLWVAALNKIINCASFLVAFSRFARLPFTCRIVKFCFRVVHN